MVELDPTNPVWHRYKHKHARIDSVLVFPAGAGGHWLAGLTVGWHHEMTDVNEYNSDCLYLLPENAVRLSDDGADTCIDLAELDRICAKGELHGDHAVAMAHYPPMLSHLTHDLTVGEVFSMEPGDLLWFIDALCQIKHGFGRSYRTYHSMWYVLNRDPWHGPIDAYEYHLMITALRHLQSPILPLDNAPLTWRWLLHCKATGRDCLDSAAFREFITERVFWMLLNDAPNAAFAQHHAHSLGYMRSVSTVHAVDWGSMFLDLRIPDATLTKPLDRSLLRDYMQRNMLLLDGIEPLLCDRHRDLILHKLSGIKSRFAAAG